MSYILASGCSYTDKDFRYRKNNDWVNPQWDVWPTLLEKHLKLPVTNIAQSGNDNSNIIDNAFDYIHFYNKKPKVICILLSEWCRANFFGASMIPHQEFRHYLINNGMTNPSPFDHWWPPNEWDDYKKTIYSDYEISRVEFLFRTMCMAKTKTSCKVYPEETEYKRFIHRLYTITFRKIYQLIEYCKKNNIKLIIAQGLGIDMIFYTACKTVAWLKGQDLLKFDPSLRSSLEQLMNTWKNASEWDDKSIFLNNPYFKLIEEESTHNNINLIGWPWYKELGGNTICQRHVNKEWTVDFIIENDGHPNEKGHAYIADIFIKEYEKMK